MDLHLILNTFSYLGIFLLMVSNGIINFPSSQFLYVIVGYLVSKGSLLFLPALLAGALGNTIGNMIAFLLISTYGNAIAHKLLFVDEHTFKKVFSTLHATFAQRGMWYLFIGKLIPSIKAFIPTLAGLSKTKPSLTLLIFAIASLIWGYGLMSLGYYFGEKVSLAPLMVVSLGIALMMLLVIYKKVQASSKENHLD